MTCEYSGQASALVSPYISTAGLKRLPWLICRVLKPGGFLLLITYGSPEFRLPHLIQPALNWKVQMMTLSKLDPEKEHSKVEFSKFMDPSDTRVS